MGSNHGKTGGRKSRDALPLKGQSEYIKNIRGNIAILELQNKVLRCTKLELSMLISLRNRGRATWASWFR